VIGKTLRDLDPDNEKAALDAIHSEYNLQSGSEAYRIVTAQRWTKDKAQAGYR
jgi:hypothetical protein